MSVMDEPTGTGWAAGLPRSRRDVRALAGRVLGGRLTTLVVADLLFVVALTLSTPAFATVGNLRVVALGMAIDAILVVGMTVVIVSGGFDLSIGAILALAAVSVGIASEAGLPVLVVVLTAIVVGAACGLVNGVLIARVGVNALIATLGMAYVFRGIALIVSGGVTVSATGTPFVVETLGQGSVAGVSMPVVVAVAVVVLGAVGLHVLRAARSIFYVGGNPEAARLSGIPVGRVQLGAYLLMGILAGLAAILTIGRVGNASAATVGIGRELAAITAVILGGASLRGGEGSILGSMLALVLLGLVTNALILLAIPVFYQQLSVGLVLILAVVANLVRERVRKDRLIRSALSGSAAVDRR